MSPLYGGEALVGGAGEELVDLPIEHGLTRIALAPDGLTMVGLAGVGTEGAGVLRVVDLARGTLRQTRLAGDGQAFVRLATGGAAQRPMAVTAHVGALDSVVNVVDLVTAERIDMNSDVPGEQGLTFDAVNDVVVSAQGRVFVAPQDDLTLWEVSTEEGMPEQARRAAIRVPVQPGGEVQTMAAGPPARAGVLYAAGGAYVLRYDMDRVDAQTGPDNIPLQVIEFAHVQARSLAVVAAPDVDRAYVIVQTTQAFDDQGAPLSLVAAEFRDDVGMNAWRIALDPALMGEEGDARPALSVSEDGQYLFVSSPAAAPSGVHVFRAADGRPEQVAAIPGVVHDLAVRAARPAERCDGADDDCDGRVDEGLGLGDACVSVGACDQVGALLCGPAGGVICSTGPGGPDSVAEPEVCDGADNDCDGDVDEGLTDEYEPPFPDDVGIPEAPSLSPDIAATHNADGPVYAVVFEGSPGAPVVGYSEVRPDGEVLSRAIVVDDGQRPRIASDSQRQSLGLVYEAGAGSTFVELDRLDDPWDLANWQTIASAPAGAHHRPALAYRDGLWATVVSQDPHLDPPGQARLRLWAAIGAPLAGPERNDRPGTRAPLAVAGGDGHWLMVGGTLRDAEGGPLEEQRLHGWLYDSDGALVLGTTALPGVHLDDHRPSVDWSPVTAQFGVAFHNGAGEVRLSRFRMEREGDRVQGFFGGVTLLDGPGAADADVVWTGREWVVAYTKAGRPWIARVDPWGDDVRRFPVTPGGLVTGAPAITARERPAQEGGGTELAVVWTDESQGVLRVLFAAGDFGCGFGVGD